MFTGQKSGKKGAAFALFDEPLSAIDTERFHVFSLLGVVHVATSLDRNAAVHYFSTPRTKTNGRVSTAVV